jgi:hypothetical protein
MKTHTYFLIALIILTSCASSRKVSEAYQNRKVKFGVEAGANKGGIVENTDLTKVENTPVDGFTGATSMGFHVGAHAVIPLGRNDVQAGLSYFYSPQTFSYNDAVNGYFGTRKISLSQLVVPVTYNINLFKRKLDPETLCLKLGGVLEYNMPLINDEGSHLTDYSIKKISGGVTLGISTMPFRFSDQSKLGLSFDFYKGTQIFDDFYNRPEFEMPTSSYMKLSIIYQFK